MARYFKTEGNLIYPNGKDILTWGPFYYHSLDKAKAKMDEIKKWIVEWVNEQDKTLNIQPEIFERSGGRTMVFKIKAWKDEQNLQDCNVLINVEDIFFEDE